jgi:D-alanyl-D-alanine carboxypeptidase
LMILLVCHVVLLWDRASTRDRFPAIRAWLMHFPESARGRALLCLLHMIHCGARAKSGYHERPYWMRNAMTLTIFSTGPVPAALHKRHLLRRLAAGCLLALAPLLAPQAAAAAPAVSNAAMASIVGPDFNGVVLVKPSSKAAPAVAAFGSANVARGEALRPESLFQVGSITKWITSVAVLRLVDRGLLQLDTPVVAWLPELAVSGSTVTLRHLLSNSSGIPNDFSPAFKRDPASVLLPLSMLEASQRFASRAPLFAPGSDFDYASTNWMIVGAILERVAGKPFAQVLTDEVFTPAGLRSTGVPAAAFETIAGAAISYGADLPRKPKTLPHLGYVAATGTVYSTAADLARLADAVYEGTLLSKAARAALSHIEVSKESYALGGRVRQYALGGVQRTVAIESGVSAGYKSLLLHVPGEGKTVVLLNNTDLSQDVLAEHGVALLRTTYE